MNPDIHMSWKNHNKFYDHKQGIMVKKDRGLADPKQFFFKNQHPKFCLNDSYTLLKVNNLLSLAQ